MFSKAVAPFVWVALMVSVIHEALLSIPGRVVERWRAFTYPWKIARWYEDDMLGLMDYMERLNDILLDKVIEAFGEIGEQDGYIVNLEEDVARLERIQAEDFDYLHRQVNLLTKHALRIEAEKRQRELREAEQRATLDRVPVRFVT